MDTTASAFREVAVPVSVFALLRKELASEAGTLPTIHAFHVAGYQSGVAAASAFRSAPDEDVSALQEDEFWTRVTAFFSRRGWGSLSRTTSSPAVGLLVSQDWVESTDVDVSEDASCSFSTGFLSGLLTALAGGPVAVLEVECRGRGGGSCSFAFGSESAVHELYGHLVDGKDLDGALAAL
jgi:predicted hydrocarbon binding protein